MCRRLEFLLVSTRHRGALGSRTLMALTAVLALAVTPARAKSPMPTARPGRIIQSAQDISQATAQLLKRLAAGVADPRRDAQAAAASGDFGFVESGSRASRSPGVLCRTPFQQGVSIRASTLWGDDFDIEKMKAKQTFEAYAAVYNQTIVDHPLFKAGDLCAPATQEVPASGTNGLGLLAEPARRLERPPLSLHEAARRGSVSDVRRLLAGNDPDELDAFNMTALAWAVAYGRGDIADVLLRAGASSMPKAGNWSDVTPVLAAISQRRLALLRRLETPQPYPGLYAEAAIRSGDPAIVAEVFRAPHEPLRRGWTTSLTPSVAVANLVMDFEGRSAADDLLLLGARAGNPELVQTALQRGADVDISDFSGDAPLAVALDGFEPGALPTVKLLLAAGSDVNRKPKSGHGYDTPFWKAYKRLIYSGGDGAELFDRLAKAGGDASIPMRPGVPSVWTVVFPPRGDLTEIIAPSPDILRTLTQAGMDLNAPYGGRCALDAVELLTGPQGEVAKSLRALGAKRRSVTGSCAA